nr:DEAD/DEAH box helicase [Bacteroidales bacterium]
LHFLADMREYAEDVELQWPKGERMSVLKVAAPSDVNFSVTSQLDWFELSGQVRIDEEHLISIQELLEASVGGSKTYVKIDETAFIKLNKELRKRLSEINAMAEVTEDTLKINHLGASALNHVMMSAGKTKTDKGWQQNMKRIEALRDFVPELPSNFQAELRPYQLEGYNWLSRLHAWGVGACLADDMGLGKTLQTIALLLKAAPKGPSLVVAPSSVCMNWHKEVARFAPVLNTLALTNTSKREEIISALDAFDVVVVSYGLLQSNPDLLSRVSWNVVEHDEAHAIKNMASLRSKAVMQLDAQFKMLTTGTPIQNHLGELWNLFQFINPGFLGSYDQFIKKFVVGADEIDTMAKRKALNTYISPFILRRNKSDVLDDLPAKTEVTMSIEQSEGEKALYEALRQKAVDELEEGGANDGGGHIKLLAQLSKLRMASCNVRMVEKGSHLPSSKLKALEDLVDDLLESRHKALVFSQFTKHLALIKEMLDAKGITYEYLDGSSTVKQRERSISNFQRGYNELFLISLKAGGVGLNLTAADYVIHMDPWWNPAVEDQASDRAHRIGQSRPVTVYRLVAEGTIEEKIVKLHHAKRSLADDLLSGTDKSAKISSSELFELMR